MKNEKMQRQLNEQTKQDNPKMNNGFKINPEPNQNINTEIVQIIKLCDCSSKQNTVHYSWDVQEEIYVIP